MWVYNCGFQVLKQILNDPKCRLQMLISNTETDSKCALQTWI